VPKEGGVRRAEGEISGRRPVGSPQNRKAETQARILGAAVALFAERGFDATSITAIASRAHVSRATVFWHFGDKASLFQEACRRILVPFIDELRKTLQHLDARKRLFELFNVYEQFVSMHQETIETFVRWGLESHELRAQLQRPLFALHDEFARDIRESFVELWQDPEEAAALAAAFIALLDGNLLLGLLETNPGNRELRSGGLRLLAERLLGREPSP
jgi:AcrR family transcriptional regulator